MSIRIFPFPQALDQKWWHRLSKVLILAASSIACLIGIFLTWAVIDNDKVQHEIYNFEVGYLSNNGKEQTLNQWNASYDFVDRFIAASNDTTTSNREISLKPTSLYDLETGLNVNSEWDVRDTLLKYIESGKSDKQYKIKIWHEYSFFPEILWLLIGPVIYLLLVGLYGVVLYIAYGTNPFVSITTMNSVQLQKNLKGFVSIWKRIGAFILAFFVFGIIAQIDTFLEKWMESSSTDPSSGIRDLIAVIQIVSLIGGLIIAQRVYRSIVPSAGKHKSFKLTKGSDKSSE